MKIAIPANGENLGAMVSSSLGRSPFIIIYDDNNKSFVSFKNIGYQTQDGSGLKAAEIIIRNNADILLTREIGHKAYSTLMKECFDIRILSSAGTVKSVLKKFLKKEGV